MDTRITKKRLNDHLSYDWVKYVAIIVATIFLFWFLYDVGGKKPNQAQTLDIFVLNGSTTSSASDRLEEDLLRTMRADEVVYDEKGNRVLCPDEALVTYLNDYEGYSSDSQIASVVQTKLMAGESDLILSDHGTFINYIQTWLLPLDQLIEDAEEAYAENWPCVKDYSTEYPVARVEADGRIIVSDSEEARKVRERKFWEEIRLSLDSLQQEVAVSESDYEMLSEQGYDFGGEDWSQDLTMPKFQKYGFYYAKLTDEGVEQWKVYSDELTQQMKDAGLLNESGQVIADREEDAVYVNKYHELEAEFNRKMNELSNDESMSEGYRFWGIDIRRLDLEKVRNGWFNTSKSEYKREFGEKSDNLYFALGVSNRKENNGSAYYELVKVFDYVLTNFGI